MRLASSLASRGVEVAVFSRLPVEPNPEALTLSVFGIPGEPTRNLGARILSVVREWKPTELLVQYAPQMLEPCRFGNPTIPLLVRRARRLGLPVTILAHEIAAPWPMRPDLLLGALAHRVMLTDLLHHATFFAVTTDARRERIARFAALAGVDPASIRVIRVGPNAAPLEHPSVRSGLHLGAFSSMTLGKRFDLLLEAFARVGEEEPRARLTLIGDLGRFPHRGYRRLLQAIRTHPCADRITLTGKLPLREISTAIADLTTFFHPDDIGASTRSGTLPVAFGSGVPVVAFRGIETDPLFVDGDNVLFSRSAASEIAAAVLRIAHDPRLAGRLSAGGRRLYAEHLSWPRITASFLRDVATTSS